MLFFPHWLKFCISWLFEQIIPIWESQIGCCLSTAKNDFISGFVFLFPHWENFRMNVRGLCQDRTCKRFKILVRSNSQVQYFSFICIASVRFTKKHFIASLSRVDLFFKDEVEGMNRATIIPITEGGIIPDNFLPTTLLEVWENLEAFKSRRRMHIWRNLWRRWDPNQRTPRTFCRRN